MKTTYDIKIIGYEGKSEIVVGIKETCFLLVSIIIGYIFLLYLSNVIFSRGNT